MKFYIFSLLLLISCDSNPDYDFKININHYPMSAEIINLSDEQVYFWNYRAAFKQKLVEGKWVDRGYMYYGRLLFISDSWHINPDKKSSQPLGHLDPNSTYRVKFIVYEDKKLTRRIHTDKLLSKPFNTDNQGYTEGTPK